MCPHGLYGTLGQKQGPVHPMQTLYQLNYAPNTLFVFNFFSSLDGVMRFFPLSLELHRFSFKVKGCNNI